MSENVFSLKWAQALRMFGKHAFCLVVCFYGSGMVTICLNCQGKEDTHIFIF